MRARITDHWADISEVGFVAGMRILFWLYRGLGVWAFKLALYPVLLYYLATNRLAREASLDYINTFNRWDQSATIQANYTTAYRHFLAFAQSMLDKLAVWSEQIQYGDVQFNQRELLLDQLGRSEGAILLGSHLGNLEVCRSLAFLNTQLKLNILVHTQHAGKFNKLLEELNMHRQLELIEVSELTPATAMLLNNRVARGEFLVIVGDRIPLAGASRTVELDFMGRPALFPQGPFILAGLLGCPVYTLFCLKQGQKYEIDCELFSQGIKLPRKNREETIRRYAKRYAERLEQQCRKAPLQWFNFYNFWNRTRLEN